MCLDYKQALRVRSGKLDNLFLIHKNLDVGGRSFFIIQYEMIQAVSYYKYKLKPFKSYYLCLNIISEVHETFPLL